jgi:hypothetical protein
MGGLSNIPEANSAMRPRSVIGDSSQRKPQIGCVASRNSTFELNFENHL